MGFHSLSTRLLALILVPMAVQLGFLIWLASLQSEAEHKLQQSIHAKKVADAINAISADVYEMAAQYSNERALQEIPVGETADFMELTEKVMQHYDTLRELFKNDPKTLALIDNSEAAAIRAKELLLKLKKSFDMQEERGLRKPLWRQLRQEIKIILYHSLLEMAENQKTLARITGEQEAQYRVWFQQVALVSSAANLILTTVLAIFLIQTITTRLNQVHDNTRKLAANQPLNPVMKGSDEIAHLDQTFHQMADELRESEQRRREVLGMITHDLRTPLATLKNLLDLIGASAEPANVKVQEYTGTGKRNVSRMLMLINDLLDIERISAGQLALEKDKVTLEDSFAACEESLSALAKEKNIQLNIEPTDLVVQADASKLDRILINLVANAIKHSPDGSKVTVTSRADGSFATVSVIDEGTGIPDEQRELVFERFHQVGSSTDGGSGLGLAICKALVELQGGRIWVEPADPTGCRFCFTIPV